MSIPGLQDMLSQAQAFSEQFTRMREELARRIVEASSGGGMVKVRADGRGRILAIEIERQVVDPDEVEMLQDLITAAVNQALNAAKEMAAEASKSLTGGFQIPGLDTLFS
jgi:nucleoid-associated protein EbfC